MSSRSSLVHRFRKRRKARRANHAHVGRRLRFETFEDRRLLSFTPPVNFDIGAASPNYPTVVSADFNNDGYLDLVTPCYNGKVSVLLGNGHGGFGDATLFEVGNYPLSVAVGDFNEDGKLDLATANQGDYSPNALPSVGVLLGKSDGTFEPVLAIPTEGSASSVAVGDFNGDGHLDLGVGNTDYGFAYFDWVTVHLGDGHGNFAAPKSSGGDIGIFKSATAADLNGDGADDLVFGDNRYGLGAYVFLGGNASGDLQLAEILNDGASIGDIAVGDLNGDGVPDIVTANSWSTFHYAISVFLGDSQGGYGAAQNYIDSYAEHEAKALLGDFTGDGHIDIISYRNLLRGNGDGTFAAAEPLEYFADAAGDFNGDGRLDLVERGFNSLWVMLNDGEWGQSDTNPLPGDYNGNGTVDAADYVVWRKSLGSSVTPYSGADGSGNGVVDGDDYDVVRAHFGQRALPTISLSGTEVTEGNTGTTNAIFTVTLSQASEVDVTVRYDTADANAKAGSDYIATTGMVTIPAGEISQTFTVAVLGDHLAEPTEFLYVGLSAPTNATIKKQWAYGTILDDEPRISINDVTDLEGRNNQTQLFTFTVTLSTAYDQPVTMSYQTYDGWATTSDNDYVAQAGTLTFDPGETTKTITIEVKGDNKREEDEWFSLYLLGNSGNSQFTQIWWGVGTILNDD